MARKKGFCRPFASKQTVNTPRAERDLQLHNAITFLASRRESVGKAVAGDIIGLHNHGTIQIGDAFTSGESLKFLGIPSFAPELFRRVRLTG